MPNESSVLVRLKLLGAAAMRRDARMASKGLGGVGTAASRSSRANRQLGITSRAAGSGLRVLGSAARWGGLALGAGLVVELRRSYQAFSEVAEVNAATNAVLTSTGRVAKVTAKDITGLSTAVSRYSGRDDEAVQASANLIATFTKVRREGRGLNDIFGRAVITTADLSQTFHKDLNSSAIMLGKALNDPIKGVSALGRAGVQFTAGQKEQIKALVESGRMLDAQKLILAEVETQVGGAARAYGKTLPGAMDRAEVSLGNIEESMGSGLAPAFQAGAESVEHFARGAEPRINALSRSLANAWRRPGLTPEKRFDASWAAIQATGFPNAAKKAIYTGISEVGTRAPAILVKALGEAPWPAKGVIAAILIAKMGPGIRLLGPSVGKALGMGGAAGKLASRSAPLPVFVTNPGFGGAGGLPGAAGGRAGGLLKTGAGVEIAGLGTGIGAGAGAGLSAGAIAGLGAGGIAAVVAGGIGLNKLDNRFHFMSDDPKQAQEQARRSQAVLLDAWRNGEKDLADQMGNALGPARIGLTPEILNNWATAGRQGAATFQAEIGKGKVGVHRSANELATAALRGISGLPGQSARLAADSMIRMTRSLEDNGKAPAGATRRLMRVLEQEIGRLPDATREAARRASASFGELQVTLQSLTRDIRGVVDAARDPLGAGGAAITPAEQNRIRAGRFASGGVTSTPWSLVGEHGPELARLPIGSRVYPHGRSRQMMAGRPMGPERPLYAELVVNLDGAVLHRGVHRVERRRLERA